MPTTLLASFSLYGSTISCSKPPQAVLSKSNQMQMRVPYDLKQGQSRVFHKLPSGLSMEVLVQKKDSVAVAEKKNIAGNPPLVFVHGSYHAAWCWAEHWLAFFSVSGYDCYAISLLGQVHSLPLYLYQKL